MLFWFYTLLYSFQFLNTKIEKCNILIYPDDQMITINADHLSDRMALKSDILSDKPTFYPGFESVYHILECQLCYKPVTSLEHLAKCTTTYMCEINESIISPDFKPMMTYGLCGCTALLMVFFTTDTNMVYKVVLGHYSIKEDILAWFNKYYTSEYNIITIIKTPGSYVKGIDEKWNLEADNNKYWTENMIKYNCKLILEGYGLEEKNDHVTMFNSSLYFKMSPGPKYSDNYGVYNDIKF
jgi:hypothetical protein